MCDLLFNYSFTSRYRAASPPFTIGFSLFCCAMVMQPPSIPQSWGSLWKVSFHWCQMSLKSSGPQWVHIDKWSSLYRVHWIQSCLLSLAMALQSLRYGTFAAQHEIFLTRDSQRLNMAPSVGKLKPLAVSMTPPHLWVVWKYKKYLQKTM